MILELRVLSRSKCTQSTVRKGYFLACFDDGGLETDEALKALVSRSSTRPCASGNLTVAIFMQPYYTSSENAQENYESAITQAIGRAQRWGQVS